MSDGIVLYDDIIKNPGGEDAHCSRKFQSHLSVMQFIDNSTNSSDLVIEFGFTTPYSGSILYGMTSDWRVEVIYNGKLVETCSARWASFDQKQEKSLLFSVSNIKHNANGKVPSDALKIRVIGYARSCDESFFSDNNPYPWRWIDRYGNPYPEEWEDLNEVNEYAEQWPSTTTIALQPATVYQLTVSPGENSSITVKRTSSGYATPSTIRNGAYIYEGDDLKITFTPAYHYKITYGTVNGLTFVSGNTYKVVGDTTTTSVAELYVSTVTAQNAYIGSSSRLNVDKYQASDYHSIKFTFGSQTGYVRSDGTVSSTEVRYTNPQVAFALPDSFYNEIPNVATGVCTLECTTYEHEDDEQALGRITTTTFNALANPAQCSPVIVGTVVDTNATTLALTNNATRLVRYRSTANCTWTVTPRKGATITGVRVNGKAPTNSEVVFNNTDTNNFEFVATDSRGITGTYVVTLSMVDYIVLTNNPILFRTSPTDDRVYMTISGDWFRGYFDADHPEIVNDLWISYRYKRVNGNWSSWQNVSPADIIHDVASYVSDGDIQLNPIQAPDDFDYRLRFTFQIRVRDGVTDSGGTVHYLSTVSKTVTVERGIPVFDWGENDFNINVALNIGGVNIFDLIYPVGTVYMQKSSTTPSAPPASIAAIGTWVAVTTGIANVYGWERTV